MAAIHHRHGGFCRELKKVRKGPFIIGVAGGTASGKVDHFLYFVGAKHAPLITFIMCYFWFGSHVGALFLLKGVVYCSWDIFFMCTSFYIINIFSFDEECCSSLINKILCLKNVWHWILHTQVVSCQEIVSRCQLSVAFPVSLKSTRCCSFLGKACFKCTSILKAVFKCMEKSGPPVLLSLFRAKL